jgi:hypothetical protein
MIHPFIKSLFDNDDYTFQAPFLRTDVQSSQHRSKPRGAFSSISMVAPNCHHRAVRNVVSSGCSAILLSSFVLLFSTRYHTRRSASSSEFQRITQESLIPHRYARVG